MSHIRAVSISRIVPDEGGANLAMPADDEVVVEEPLEIRVRGSRIAVVMRTPGDDTDLVRGFLLTEGIVTDAAHISRIETCDTKDTLNVAEGILDDADDNVVEVSLRSDVDLDLDRFRRNLYATSSCGVCGKAALENVMRMAAPVVDDGTTFRASEIVSLPARLRRRQSTFTRTGGLHAAGLFDPARSTSRALDSRHPSKDVDDNDPQLFVVREDVGRHNAVDKVIGHALANNELCPGLVLVVSGRVSFEIMQKAAAARVAVVIAVSAPSSLAIELAHSLGITLLAFTRNGAANVYAHGQRIVG